MVEAVKVWAGSPLHVITPFKTPFRFFFLLLLSQRLKAVKETALQSVME